MNEYIATLLIKVGLKMLPFTPESHKILQPVINKWVDDLNKIYWKPYKVNDPAIIRYIKQERIK